MNKFPIRGIPILLLASISAGSVVAEPCAQFETRAIEIRELRDSRPAEGVSQGEDLLLELDTVFVDCPRARALLLGSIGSNLHILGRNNEARKRFESALELAAVEAEAEVLAVLHRGAGVVFADLEMHDRALEQYLASLAASEAMGDVIEVAKTSSNIGNLYNILGELDESRQYHLRALKSFEQVDWPMGIAGASINLGSLSGKFAAQFEAAGELEQAHAANEALRDYNLRALEIFQELGNQRGIAYAANNIATAMDRLDQTEDALAYHQTALELRQEIGDTFGIIQSLMTMASSQIGLGNHGEAERLLDEAQAAMPENNLSLALDLAQRRVMLEESRGNFRQALEMQREVTKVRAAMAEEEARTRVDEVRESFAAEQREQLIELLRSEATVADLRSQRQALAIRVSLAIAALLIVLIMLLYSRYRFRVQASAELNKAARTDPLTGLANRRDIREQIEQGLRDFKETGRAFSLIMADIDDFKPINDQLGHEAGDKALIHLAEVLRGQIRGRDTVARWGGEEFLIYLPDTDLAAAEKVAENLKRHVGAAPVTLNGKEFLLSLTFGATESRRGQTLDQCIGLADEAMYQGKSRGKNQIVTLAESRPNRGQSQGPGKG